MNVDLYVLHISLVNTFVKMNVIKLHCMRSLCRQLSTSCGVFSYKSAICLENIYPKSNLSITTATEVAVDPNCPNFSGFIPIDKLHITYSSSSGPGGQNVNMVNTKVDLRFHVASADWISKDIRDNILEQHKSRITKEGFLVFRSDKTRFQHLNLADALERLRALIRAVALPVMEVSPETEEKLRKRREKNARIRLVEKRARSLTKQQRNSPSVDF
ncbi:peptidyl-tRNA hydrolase ICT1, mitochondrial [Zootermopsis nevadensis]|uniref:Large ribosomal subunit protein mL62 n=1 Tax=Zootermopsis nevadensis TaxID=136037 RepID=A0A067R267_ZOONE|nr:peptidyl-tRNA hydrolase ICT1, mitochondrial [Zootermopsis nevadensis]KDR13002.1 Immature colon carcinoma transcript 1 protein [Zootermopsis nevadensis]